MFSESECRFRETDFVSALENFCITCLEDLFGYCHVNENLSVRFINENPSRHRSKTVKKILSEKKRIVVQIPDIHRKYKAYLKNIYFKLRKNQQKS